MIRSYQELVRLETFDERFAYLSLSGEVGRSTFGFDRWINQQFYASREWHRARSYVITRDNGCDLGALGYEIHKELLVHHINPITPDDLRDGAAVVLDPDNLITTTQRTHNAIHYGDRNLSPRPVVERRAGDTKLW
jgi:hypothetical protein